MKKRVPKHRRHGEYPEQTKYGKPTGVRRRVLTAEGYRRREGVGCETKKRSLYRGRRPGKEK